MSEFVCPCGFKAKFRSKYLRHMSATRKCDYLKTVLNNKDKTKTETQENKEIENNSETQSNANDNTNIDKIVKEYMPSIKSFISLFESSSDSERLLLCQSEQYKKWIDFFLKYNSTYKGELQVQHHDTTNNITTNNTDSNNINTTTNSHNQMNNNQINQINQTNNNIINNTTNNITNNNTNISVVYPFGYENIYFMSDIEMIKILTGGNCLIDAMNKIYSNTENKNFMKRNVKIENVTIIDKSCYIKVLKDDIFKRQIIKQTFESLKLMFKHCKNKLNIEHQIMLWQNLRILDESIKENITTEKEENMSIEIRQILDNITSMIYEKNECAVSKIKFMEIKNSMINPEFKRVFDENLNHIVSKMQEFRDDYNNRIIDLEFIMKNIWTRDLEKDQELSITHPDNHIKAHDVVDTPRYKFFEEMAKLENEYLAAEERNTTGNIDSLCGIREENADKEYKTYTKKYDLDVKERKTLERKVKTERKYGARDKMVANQKKILKKLEANSSKA